MPFDVTMDLSDLRRALGNGQRALERETSHLTEVYAKDVADDARANHPYTDRTGDLTSSIQAIAGPGLYEAQVFAGTEYASYVEEGVSGRSRPYPYLGPASERAEDPARLAFYVDAVCRVVTMTINRG